MLCFIIIYSQQKEMSSLSSRLADREREREREKVLARSREQVSAAMRNYQKDGAGSGYSLMSKYLPERESSSSTAPTSDPPYMRRSSDSVPTSSATMAVPLPQSSVDNFSRDVSKWSVDRVQKWLTQNGLSKHASSFMRNEVDGSILLTLTAADLVDELRIQSLQERRAIHSLIRQLSSANTPSLGNSRADSDLPQVNAEAETSIIEAIIKSEMRRIEASLKHDNQMIEKRVSDLQESLNILINQTAPNRKEDSRLNLLGLQ